MIKALIQRWRDIRTLHTLLMQAEQLANAQGVQLPGAEHLVQSALLLPDGTARQAFVRAGVNPDAYQQAINQQYEDALKNVGIELPSGLSVSHPMQAIETSKGPYKAQSSANTLIQKMFHEVLAPDRKVRPLVPLLGAHVLIAATLAQHSVAVRSMKVMTTDPSTIAQAAKTQVLEYCASHGGKSV